MAALEEVCKLSRERKFDLATKVALENWGRLSNLEQQERQHILSTTLPEEQTIVWMAVLFSELDQHMIDWNNVLSCMAKFAASFSDEQIQLMPHMFCQLFHIFVDSLCTNRKAMTGISIVIDVINKFSPTDKTLTAIHSDLIQLCLAARCVKPCLPFLERDYNDLYTDHGQFECQKVVQFYYYGGMVYTCLHDYIKALQCLTICLCVPTVSTSAVMLAAYKKYILVSLLRYGKVISLPRCSNDLVDRIMKTPARQYIELAKCYSECDQIGLNKILTGFVDNFIADGNYGLVQRLQTRMSQHAVQRLTMSFLKLPLLDAAQRIELSGPEEMEKMLRDMIENNEVNAIINQVEGRVEFLDGRTNDVYTVQELEKRLKQCIQLHGQLSEANRQLSTDARYIQKSGGTGMGLDDDPLHEEHLL